MNVRVLLYLLLVIFIPFFPLANAQESNKEHPALPDKIDHYLQLSAELVDKDLDSSMYYAEQANQLIESISSDSTKINVYKTLGSVYNARGNFDHSLINYFKAKEIIDRAMSGSSTDIQDTDFAQFDILNRIGILFFNQKNYPQSLKYYNEAMNVMERAEPGLTRLNVSYKIRLLSNIAAVYIQQNEYDKALDYYKSALRSDVAGGNEKLQSTLYNNMGICYMEKNDFNMANYYFQTALAIRSKLKDIRGEAQCYNNIGKNYVYNGNFSKAKENFLKALALGRKINSRESMVISLESLSSVYDTLNEYESAFRAYKEFKSINDSLFNIESINRIAQLEKQYEFDKQQRLFDLELKRKETEREKAELLYIVIGGSLFFLLLTAILLIFLQRSKIKNTLLLKSKLELEHRHITLEKQKLQEELEFKNRELTTNVMYLLKKNELITGISEKLIKLKLNSKVENQKIIQEIINELKSTQDKDVWSEFEAHFTQVHVEFYNKLNEHFPNLSSNEKKLCAFLRLNMSTKDISAITYQSVNSITVARSRLRKKLDIQGEDVNLVNYLMQL